MTLLTDYAFSVNSQFGEDGIIFECLNRIWGNDHKARTCIEVGASDGRECSNTLHLRDIFGWKRILIEADPVLVERQDVHSLDTSITMAIERNGPNSLDRLVPDGCEFLSLDIDGDEYGVLHDLKMRPYLICAEFNQTIPWHLEIKSPTIGCSLKAMIRMMSLKAAPRSYSFIGATHCNAFFVRDDYVKRFEDIDMDPARYVNEENYTYLITTPYGGAVAFGPQWFGVQKRFAGEIDIVGPDGNWQTMRFSDRSTRPN